MSLHLMFFDEVMTGVCNIRACSWRLKMWNSRTHLLVATAFSVPIHDWKNFRGWMASIRRSFPKLQQSKVDIISLEMPKLGHVPMDLIELIRGKKWWWVRFDVASNQIETPEQLQIPYAKLFNLWMLTSFILQPTVEWRHWLTLLVAN